MKDSVRLPNLSASCPYHRPVSVVCFWLRVLHHLPQFGEMRFDLQRSCPFPSRFQCVALLLSDVAVAGQSDTNAHVFADCVFLGNSATVFGGAVSFIKVRELCCYW
jgi:predicted outer membrane repeat protein